MALRVAASLGLQRLRRGLLRAEQLGIGPAVYGEQVGMRRVDHDSDRVPCSPRPLVPPVLGRIPEPVPRMGVPPADDGGVGIEDVGRESRAKLAFDGRGDARARGLGLGIGHDAVDDYVGAFPVSARTAHNEAEALVWRRLLCERHHAFDERLRDGDDKTVPSRE